MKLLSELYQSRPAGHWLCLLSLACIYVGLIFSPVLLSMGLIGLPLTAVVARPGPLGRAWLSHLPRLWRDPVFWALALLYGILLVGWWSTYDWAYYLERLRIKSVLLAAPLAWIGLPRLGRRDVDRYWAFCMLVLSGTALAVLANYAIHFEAIDQAIREGRAVPVPRNHIRFSLLVALTTLISLDAGRRQALGHRRWWLAAAVFFFLFQHVLAVRSGLVLAYGGLLVYGLWWAISRAAWKQLVLGLLALLVIGAVAPRVIPSLQARIDYLRYELWRSEQGLDGRGYSDHGRWRSIRIGLDIWQDNLWLGVGPGNLLAETDRRYQREFGMPKGLRPHNQLVSTLAGSGLLGGLLFCTSAGLLLFAAGRPRYLSKENVPLANRMSTGLLLAIWAILFGSMMVENTLETSAGVAMFSFYVLMGWRELG